MKKVFTLTLATLLLGTASLVPNVLAQTKLSATQQEVIYTCPMHPEVQSKVKGKCPQCGMNLIPAKEEQK